MHASSHVLSEVMVIGTVLFMASADLAVKSEAVTPDQILVLWCVIGGMVGAFGSLQFFPTQNRAAAAWQLGVNLGLSAMVSPLLVDLIGTWTGYPIGLRLALPIACGVGIGGQQAVARVIPKATRWLDRRASIVIGDDEGGHS